MRLAFTIGLAALICTTVGCVRLRWNSAQRFVVIPVELTEDFLEPGQTDLEACLTRYGAPLFVYEQPRETFAIAYGWFAESNFGGAISIPVAEALSLSFNYDNLTSRLHGIVLFFDADGTLQLWRRGFLRDILPGEMAPPAYIEEEAGG